MRISNIVFAFVATLASADAAPTAAPSVSAYPSGSPSGIPSGSPSGIPSGSPSGIPSLTPTFKGETRAPSESPSSIPVDFSTFDIEVPKDVDADILETAVAGMINAYLALDSRRLEPMDYAATAPAVTVVATVIDCATLDTTTAATSVCYSVFSTVTASPSTGVDPSAIIATLDANVLSGVAATDLTAQGVTPLFINLPPSDEPSSAPSIDCTNEESFSVSDGKMKTCDWVAKANTDRRCNKLDYLNNRPVFLICPLVCNPACVTSRSAAPTLAPTTSYEPSFSPTFSAPTICKSKKNFDYNGNTCDWVAENPDKRCKKKIRRLKKKKIIKRKYKSYCKGACNPRCTCKNTKKPIKFKDTTKYTKCYKISVKNCDKPVAFRAGGKMRPAYEVCAKRCGACYFD